MIISLIAAVALDGTIGKDGQLPWAIAEDMGFFVDTTAGHVVITGRKNFDAMGGPLPHRTNIVLSRDANYSPRDAHVLGDLVTALRFAAQQGEHEVFIIGGAQIYTLAKPYAHRFYRTVVLANVDGEVKYLDDDFDGWNLQVLSHGEKNAHNEHAFRIELWSRTTPEKTYDQGAPASTTSGSGHFSPV